MAVLQVGQVVRVEQVVEGRPVGGEALVIRTAEDWFVGSVLRMPQPLQLGPAVVKCPSALGLHHARAEVTELLARESFESRLLEPFALRQERRFFRVPAQGPLLVTVVRAAEPGLVGREERASLEDLSVGGLRFRSGLPLSVGDLLMVELTADTMTKAGEPASPPLRIEGMVRRVTGERGTEASVALEWDAVPAETRQRLLALVRRLHPQW